MWPGCCVCCCVTINDVSVELLLWLFSTLDRRDTLPPGSAPAPELLVEEAEVNPVGEGVEAAGAELEAVLEAVLEAKGVMGEEEEPGKGVMEEPGSGWE